MKSFKCLLLFVVASTFYLESGLAACAPSSFNLDDVLSSVLRSSSKCPHNVLELKSALQADGIVMEPAMVANRGFHNPGFGSFSIFESSKGYSNSLNREIFPEHLYFGHFTGVKSGNVVDLDQDNASGKLLIEAIAFDFKKKVYNFYELIGGVGVPRWIYRGDSFDAFEDNKNLKMGNGLSFGRKMRCSACHNSGGPIMKELAIPHYDWWSVDRKLPFGQYQPSNNLNKYLNELVDASVFAQNVKAGIKLLEESNLANSLSIKEQLRPLFCTTEVNLISDEQPFAMSSSLVSISSESFVNPLLVSSYEMKMSKTYYHSALLDLSFKFPETTLHTLDADHPFLVPVKGYTNIQAIERLLERGIVDSEFVLDILAYDFKNALFSKKRCSLMSFIDEDTNWMNLFMQKLSVSNLAEHKNLLADLKVSNSNKHEQEALEYLDQKENSWQFVDNVRTELVELNTKRLSVYRDDISKNPLGQILEPGFRVIFPFIE